VYISSISIYVAELDRAIAFYRDVLGWHVTDDRPMAEGTRWVTVAPAHTQTAFCLVHRFADWTPEKVGGWSGIVIDVDDVEVTYQRWRERGVEFVTAPRREPWGTWAAFADSEGNEFGLHDQRSVQAAPEKGLISKFIGI
jgi:predicted enzyme related to lactoylglutathione lyase